MERAKKEEGRRTRARKEQKEEERGKKRERRGKGERRSESHGGGGPEASRRASFTREIWAVFRLDARSSLRGHMGSTSGSGARMCASLGRARVRVRACACVCVCAAIRACWEEELYTRCPPCAAINYRVTRYGRARPTLYISRKTCRRRYLKCGFLYGFSYPRITRSNFSSTISSMRGDVFTGKINSFEIYIYYQSYAQVLLVTSLMEGNIDTFRMLKVKRRGGIICSWWFDSIFDTSDFFPDFYTEWREVSVD